MPKLDQIRAEKLIQLARERFDPKLKRAELKVLRDSASSEDLPDPGEKAPRPEVRPAFLRWLASDPEAAPHIDPKGLRVYAATIPGKLDLEECHVNPTLDFRRCDFQGEIYLLSAETRGLYFSDSSLAGGIGADGVIVHGPLFLQNIQSEGEILLLGARIEGILNCNGAKLKAKGDALNADRAKIGGSVYLMDGFETKGAIRLHSAKIAGQLACNGATLRAKGVAIIADGMKIGGGIFLEDGFESDGEILLAGAEIGGDLAVVGAKVVRVVCENTVITGDLYWQRIERSNDTSLNLIGARVKNLRDDKKSWPVEGNLDLDGLVYEELTLHEPLSDENIKANRYTSELPLVAKERIEWIILQEPDCRTEPQPWMQLRDLLERKGDRKGAKYVLRRFRCLQAQKSWVLRRWLSIAFAWLEENPLRILWSIAFTLLIGTSIFTWGGSKHAMIETVRLQPNMIRSYEETKDNLPNKPVSDHYPRFQPFVYTLENAVPLIKLGMDEKWAPDPRPEFCRPWFPRLPWLYFVSTYGVLSLTRWLLIVWGWAQATILAASLVDRFKK